MKILHVMGKFAPSGAERQLSSTLAAAVAADLWEPHLLVLRSGFPFVTSVAEHGVPVTELGFPSDRDPRRLSALRSFVKRGGFDVVHSTLWGSNAITRAALVGTSRPAVVVSERRVEDYRSQRSRRIDRLLRSTTDHYIGNSRAVGAFIERAHSVKPDRITVIPNGVDTGTFKPRMGLRPAREVPRIGSMGRLIPLKGFDVLLRALPEVLGQREVEVQIAGDGPERPSLEAAAQGLPVEFLGSVDSRADVADFLRDLDLFVLPSYAEGLPNVILEATACGVPVVATDAPGIAEAVPGIALVPAGDASALATALVRALDSPHISTASGIAQSFEAAARQHLAAFERAVNSRSRGTSARP